MSQCNLVFRPNSKLWPVGVPNFFSPVVSFYTVCGKPQFSGKVMGGQLAPEKKWPWQVSLWYRGLFICGGSLIDYKWVLTATHCFQKSTDPNAYKIFLGNNKLQKENGHSFQVSVRKIFSHPNFKKNHPFESDIALLELKSSVASSPYILPICLPAPGLYYERKSCWITGWGTLTETEIYLQEANIPVIDNHTCSSFYGVPIEGNVIYEIKEDMLCAGDIINQRAICVGDSGSPLVCEFSETWIQVGIASWGMACVPPVSPSVFSRVSYYLDWIDRCLINACGYIYVHMYVVYIYLFICMMLFFPSRMSHIL
uniref:Peptidase S1 domain-containing protein n=1 Tax=Vombatus ursinus TaxID=29139 RepID=A0A4X2KYK0_VOMUR